MPLLQTLRHHLGIPPYCSLWSLSQPLSVAHWRPHRPETVHSLRSRTAESLPLVHLLSIS